MKIFICLIVSVSLLCSCKNDAADFTAEYNQQIIEIGKVDAQNINFHYTPSKDIELSFIINETFSKGEYKICVQREGANKSELLLESKEFVDLNDVVIRQYSYNIITIYFDNSDKWLNVYEFMTEDEKQKFESKQPIIEDVCGDIKNAYLIRTISSGEETVRIPEKELNKLLDELSKIKGKSYVNYDGRPTWAIFGRLYIEDAQNIYELKVATDGIIFNGGFYNYDVEEIKNLIVGLD